MKRSESFFHGFDGLKLYSQMWEVENPKGTILITHGQSEHSECYHRLTEFFKNDSWNFIGWDLRGHGRSEGKRGFVMHFDDYCKDFEIALDLATRKKVPGPFITLAHSMGGLIQLKALLNTTNLMNSLSGQILSAPFLGLSLPVPAWKTKGAKWMYAIKPDITLSNEIGNGDLTRDSEVLREYTKDTLRHGRISPGAFLGSVQSWDFVIENASKVKIPSLVVMSDKDPIVNTPSVKTFFERMSSQQKQIFLYPNAKHETFNDTIRKTVFQDVKNFLDGILKESK